MISYQKALSLLESHQNFERNLNYSYPDLKLERVKKALAFFKNPQEKYPHLLIAGTNGKGSTALLLRAGLEANLYRVGLYTSPHLTDIRERIQVNGKKIPKRSFACGIKHIQSDLPRNLRKTLTYFEILTILAFRYFAKEKVDIAVLEVGLGGRLDATNVVNPLVSIITSIHFDHESKLGRTLPKITQEKAGIIKRQGRVVSAPQEKVVKAKIKEIAKKRKANLHFVSYHTSHIRTNQTLALKVLAMLRQDYHYRLPSKKTETAIKKAVLPGRLECLRKKPTIYLDGAHNASAIERTIQFLKKMYPKRKILLLFGVAKDKNLKRILHVLEKAKLPIVFTRSYFSRAAEPKELARAAKNRLNILALTEDPKEGLQKSIDLLGSTDILLITGSFYLVGDLREYILKDRRPFRPVKLSSESRP